MKFRRIQIRKLGAIEALDVDLADKPGPLVAVCGRNGAGKTTLLELLIGSVTRKLPTRGDLVGLATARDSSLKVSFEYDGRRYAAGHLLDGTNRKSEATLSNGDGRPLLETTKVSAFDAYVGEHFPPSDVLLVSTFAAQQSGGFIDARPADRKALLLRILGIEHIEALAIGARAAVTDTERTIAKLQGRIEQTGSDDLATLRELLATREATRGAQEIGLQAARLALRAAEELKAEADRLFEQRHQWKRRRQELADRVDDIAASRADLELRRKNNLELTEKRAGIEAAVAEVERLQKEDRELAELHSADRGALQTALDQKAQHIRRLAELQREAGQLAPVVGMRPDLDRAKERVAQLESEAQRLADERMAADGKVAALREAAGANRISDLRIGLAAIRDSHSVIEAARDTAAATLTRDDEAAAASSGVEQARQELAETARKWELKVNEVKLARRYLEREAEVVAAEARTESLKADMQREQGEIGRIDAGLPELQNNAAGRDRARTAVAAQLAAAQKIAKLHAQLQVAASKVEEYDRQLAKLDADLAIVKAAIDDHGPEPAAPDASARGPLEEARAEVEASELALRQAIEAEAGARGDVAAAEKLATERARLEAELAAATADLGDWQLLAKDLGKDGLQATLVDAALPELATLTNSLLHANFGPRFTVDLRSQVASASGKKTLETLEVWVIDSEHGREAPIETYSGGERTIIGEAISLALTTLASRTSGLAGATLIRDEAGAALDPVNGRAWIAMLRQAVAMMGADRLLFVSHSAELAELADSRIDL